MRIIEDRPTLIFALSTYTLQTEEAERISVDQVRPPVFSPFDRRFLCPDRCGCPRLLSAMGSVEQVSHILPTGSSGASTAVSTHLGSVSRSARPQPLPRPSCDLPPTELRVFPKTWIWLGAEMVDWAIFCGYTSPPPESTRHTRATRRAPAGVGTRCPPRNLRRRAGNRPSLPSLSRGAARSPGMQVAHRTARRGARCARRQRDGHAPKAGEVHRRGARRHAAGPGAPVPRPPPPLCRRPAAFPCSAGELGPPR